MSEFDDTQRSNYKSAVAAAVEMAVSKVSIRNVEEAESISRMGAIDIDTRLDVPEVPEDLTIGELNDNLKAQGLPTGQFTVEPKVVRKDDPNVTPPPEASPSSSSAPDDTTSGAFAVMANSAACVVAMLGLWVVA